MSTADESHRAHASAAADAVAALTSRELAIVELLAQGMSNREIGDQLHLAEATVKAHLGRIMAKWQVRDRLQVVLRYLGR